MLYKKHKFARAHNVAMKAFCLWCDGMDWKSQAAGCVSFAEYSAEWDGSILKFSCAGCVLL